MKMLGTKVKEINRMTKGNVRKNYNGMKINSWKLIKMLIDLEDRGQKKNVKLCEFPCKKKIENWTSTIHIFHTFILHIINFIA